MEDTGLTMQFKYINMCIDIQQFIQPKWCISVSTWLCSLLFKWLNWTAFHIICKKLKKTYSSTPSLTTQLHVYSLKREYMVESVVNKRNIEIKMSSKITSPLSESALETKDQSTRAIRRKMFTWHTTAHTTLHRRIYLHTCTDNVWELKPVQKAAEWVD